MPDQKMKKLNAEILAINGSDFPWRKSVQTVSTAAITLASVVGTTINGVVITSTTRFLLTAQASAIENGIWVGTSRPLDFAPPDTPAGTIIYDTNRRNYWACTNTTSAVIGTSALTFVRMGISNFATLTNPTSGQLLSYNGTDWVNITSVTNFSITSPSVGQVLVYDGSNWINSTPSSVSTVCAPTAELAFAGSYSILLAVQNNWYMLAPTTSVLSNNTSFTSTAWLTPASGVLRWAFPFSARAFHCAVSLAVSISASNQNIECALHVNGIQSEGSVVRQRLTASSDNQMFSFHKILVLDQSDNVAIYARNITSANTTLNIQNFNLVMMSCCSYPPST